MKKVKLEFDKEDYIKAEQWLYGLGFDIKKSVWYAGVHPVYETWEGKNLWGRWRDGKGVIWIDIESGQ